MCSTNDEFFKIYSTHVATSSMQYSELRDNSGCLMPCEHYEYDMDLEEIAHTPATAGLFDFNVTSVAFSLASTELPVVTEVYLYGASDLVGDIGGCLGMFLGVSMVSIYQMALDVFDKAMRKAK